MKCIIYGNPVDGLKIIGPFNNDDPDPVEYASNNINEDWWVTELEAPEFDLAVKSE